MVNVIIVAGGIGTRMNANVPKQFMLLHQQPVILYSIRQFLFSFPDCNIVIVFPSDYLEMGKKIVGQYSHTDNIQFVVGGETRFHSVKNGLDAIESDGIVFIHDAVRPCITDDLLKNLYIQTQEFGNAIPCIDIKDSIRELTINGNKAIDRSKLKAIQTPQTFKVSLIKKAFEQTYNSSFTDEASVVESMDEKINLIDGIEQNIKITKPLDLEIASIFLNIK